MNTKHNAQEYFDWLSKFETKKTTDDCYTPPAVYNVVLEYVNNHVINLDDLKVVRPFFPNGDYTDLSQYDDNTIVIDNPPFSLISKICDFYQNNNIKCFLFAPALTVFSPMRNIQGLTAIIAHCQIVYGNGAVVPTSFITNITPLIKVKTAPSLRKELEVIQKPNKSILPKYTYSENILMVNNLHKLCDAGINFEVLASESQFISQLVSQKSKGKTLFGGGLIVSDDMAEKLKAEKSKAEKPAIVWALSDHEKQIINRLNHA